jgi:hypothetical protein
MSLHDKRETCEMRSMQVPITALLYTTFFVGYFTKLSVARRVRWRMNGKLERILEGCGRGLMEVLSCYVSGDIE